MWRANYNTLYGSITCHPRCWENSFQTHALSCKTTKSLITHCLSYFRWNIPSFPPHYKSKGGFFLLKKATICKLAFQSTKLSFQISGAFLLFKRKQIITISLWPSMSSPNFSEPIPTFIAVFDLLKNSCTPLYFSKPKQFPPMGHLTLFRQTKPYTRESFCGYFPGKDTWCA